MDAWWVPIVAAIIAGPVMWFLHRFDKRNTYQHDRNMEALRDVRQSVDKVGDRVDDVADRLTDHIEYHLEQDNRRGRAS